MSNVVVRGATLPVPQDESDAAEILERLLRDDPHALDMLGGEHVKEGDLGQPPRLKLAQKANPETGVKAGQWYNTLTGEVYDTIEVIPLMPTTDTRCKYHIPFNKDAPLVCASDDGVMPREANERRPLSARQPGPCATCEDAQWTDNDAPRCTRQRNFMLAVVTAAGEYERVRWTAQKSAMKAAQVLTAIMASSGIRKSVLLSTKYVNDSKGEYYVPMVAAGRALKAKELLKVVNLRNETVKLLKAGGIVITADIEQDASDDALGIVVDGQDEEEIPF